MAVVVESKIDIVVVIVVEPLEAFVDDVEFQLDHVN